MFSWREIDGAIGFLAEWGWGADRRVQWRREKDNADIIHFTRLSIRMT